VWSASSTGRFTAGGKRSPQTLKRNPGKTTAGVDVALSGNRTIVRRLSNPEASHYTDWKSLPQIERWLSSSKYIRLFFYRLDIWGQ